MRGMGTMGWRAGAGDFLSGEQESCWYALKGRGNRRFAPPFRGAMRDCGGRPEPPGGG
jgi:hypothetical protein